MAARTLSTFAFAFGVLLPVSVSAAETKTEPSKSPESAPDAKPSSKETETESAKAQPETSSKVTASVTTQGANGEAKEKTKEEDGPAGAASGKGLYFRTALGGGIMWANASETPQQPELAMQAVSGNLALHPGYQFAPGFAVHADLMTAMNFAFKVSPDEASDEYTTKKIGLITSTIGVGLSYHALPNDLFVSAGAGVSGAFGSKWSYVADDAGELVLTDSALVTPSYAAHGTVGKLFSVHRRWALGGSLNYQFQTFGRSEETDLSFQGAHALWLGFSTLFRPAN